MAIKDISTEAVPYNPLVNPGTRSATMAQQETATPFPFLQPNPLLSPNGISSAPTPQLSTAPAPMTNMQAGVQTPEQMQAQIAQAAQAQTTMQDKATADQKAAQDAITANANGLTQNLPATGGDQFLIPGNPASEIVQQRAVTTSGASPAETTTKPINAGTPSGGGTTSGGSGTQTTNTTTTSGGSTPAGTTQESAWKPFADQAAQMKFSWNSATDPDYLQEASNLENQVAQMMVGRGGLYSSVYQSALQSRLTQLQATMRQEKYQEFLQERTWLMQQAEFYADREDADFSKNMQMLNYQMDLDNQKFNQQMARAELALAQAKFNFSKQQANLATQQATTKAQESNLNEQYTTYNELFKKYQSQWASSGYPSAEVQAFFGVSASDSFWGANAQSAIDNTRASIDFVRQSALQYALEANDIDSVIAASKGFATGSDAEITQMAQESKYNTLKFDIMRQIDSGSEAMTALTNVKYQKAEIINTIGQTGYNKLLVDLQTMVNAYKYNMD